MTLKRAHHQFVSLHSLYVRSGHGFILVFALNSPDSLHDLEALHETIARIKDAERVASDDYDEELDDRSEDAVGASSARKRRKGAGVPIVLCGNKSDLADERMVQRAWAVDLSQECPSKLPFSLRQPPKR